MTGARLCLLLPLAACGLGDGQMVKLEPSEKQAILVIPESSASSTITLSGEEDLMASFLAPIPNGGITSATIEADPAESPEKLAQLATFLRGREIPADRVHIVYFAANGPIALHILYRIWEMPTNCSHWEDSGLLNQHDAITDHLGCANKRDMALQVADPDDLARGQSDPRAVPETATRAAAAYLSGAAAQASSSQPSSGTSGSAGTGAAGATTTP